MKMKKLLFVAGTTILALFDAYIVNIGNVFYFYVGRETGFGCSDGYIWVVPQFEIG